MTDVATYHVDTSRTGLFPSLSFAPLGGTWRRYATLPTQAPVRAAPLFLAGFTFAAGPLSGETHDLVIVAAADNTVYAYAEDALLDGASGAIWQQSLGAPSQRGGSNIPVPVGISSTPVADRAAGVLYVMALLQQSGGDIYQIFELDLNTGTILDRETLQDPGGAGRPTFDATKQDQRGGLNLVNGWVVATFADFLAYDKGTYHGWVVACSTADLASQLFLSTTHVIGGGLWGPGGAAAASDGTMYVSTGNAMIPGSYWSGLPAGKHPGDIGDYFEGVVRVQITGGPGLSVAGWYQPTWAKALNDADLDFGGSSPLPLPLINGRQLVVTTAKDGNVYLLDGGLGGWGAELWSSVKDPGNPPNGALFGSESKCAPAHYLDPASGDHYVYVSGSDQPGLVAFRVDVSGATPALAQAWTAGLSFGDAPGSPFVTVDPTTQKALVWATDDGSPPVLRAFDALSGAPVFRSDAVTGNGLGDCPHFAPVMGTANSVLVGTNNGVACYRNVPPTMRLVIEESTFSQDEVELLLTGGGGPGFPPILVELDGFRPSDLQLNSGNLGNPPAGSIPVFAAPQFNPSLPPAVTAALQGMLGTPPSFAGPVIPSDPNLPDAPQTFFFPFRVNFAGDGGFTAMNAANPQITSTLVTLSATLPSLPAPGLPAASGQIELTTGEDPRFENLNPQNPQQFPIWQSFDLRVFKVAVAPGQTQTVFGVTMTSNPADAPGFIAKVLGNMTGANFDSLMQDEDKSKLEFLPTDKNGNRVFNFAVARVRILAESANVAKSVRVFFRLFQAQNTVSDYRPGATYRTFSDGVAFGRKVPLLGVETDSGGNPHYVTIPCFATPRVNLTTPTDMTTQADPPNVRDLATNPGGEADYFFGCWLDVNQASQRFLPQALPAGNLDGPWNNLPLYSIQEAIAHAPHQCLIAEISYDDTPIPQGAAIGGTDKLAQRNIAWIDGPNPGWPPSRRMPHPVQVRPTPAGTANPDELLIRWGATPGGGQAELYLPSFDAAEILSLANRHYSDHRLWLVDDHTIGCPADGAILVPLPQGAKLTAGLLTVDLPGGIKDGDLYQIIVRQLTDASAVLPPPPPPPPQITARPAAVAARPARRQRHVAAANVGHAHAAAVPAVFVPPRVIWRRVAGAFQFNIAISTKEQLLLPEERLLAVLRWILLEVLPSDRWYPVLQRYIGQIAGRVEGFGGNPWQIPPSPTGDVPGQPSPEPDHEEEEWETCGKVAGIIHDHFGDFEGFIIEDQRGWHHRFHTREKPLYRLVRRALRDRARVAVLSEKHRRHIVRSLILKSAGYPDDDDED